MQTELNDTLPPSNPQKETKNLSSTQGLIHLAAWGEGWLPVNMLNERESAALKILQH